MNYLKKYINYKYITNALKHNKIKIIKNIILFYLFISIIIYIFSLIMVMIYRNYWGKYWLLNVRKDNGWLDLPPPVDQSLPIPPGFRGGGEAYMSRPKSKRSEIDISYTGGLIDDRLENMKLYGNHERDEQGTRMARGWWPEFRWNITDSNVDYSYDMVYQRFDQDITRLLYNDKGEILSLICPQIGNCVDYLGCLKSEVTITHIKGWINEKEKKAHGYLKGVLAVWIDKYDIDAPPQLIQLIKKYYPKDILPFSKKNAIIIPWYNTDGGELTEFHENIPDPYLHKDAWMSISIAAYVGEVKKTGNNNIDMINNIIVNIINLGTGNRGSKGNLLRWDFYLTKPELVNKQEYMDHVEKFKVSYQICLRNNNMKGYGVGCMGPLIDSYGHEFDAKEKLLLLLNEGILKLKKLKV